ncbi:putative Coiled-coil domain-containing protein [Dioscorea sansibarensis]
MVILSSCYSSTLFSLPQLETEKHRNDIKEMCSDLRYEIDKVTAGQHLDLNLERGVMMGKEKWCYSLSLCMVIYIYI